MVAGRVILAVLEALEAVERQGLLDGSFGPRLLVEEQRMAAEPIAQPLDGVGRGLELEGDLAESRAADEAMEHRRDELGALEPVGGGEGLSAEISTASVAAPTLDAVGRGLAGVEADLLETP